MVTDGQTLFGGDADCRLTAISLRDMQIVWELVTKGLVTSAPILLGPNLVAVSEGGEIYGMAKADKKRLWPESDDRKRQVGQILAAPVVYGATST